MLRFLIVSLAFLQLLLPFTAAGSCSIADANKKDCGYAGITETECVSKSCCWSPAGENSATPWCFNAVASANGAYNLTDFEETSTGYSGVLKLQQSSGLEQYGADITTLRLDVVFETEDIVRIKITDDNNKRWEIPESVIKRPHASSKPKTINYEFSYTANPFTFEITRKADGVSIFKLANSIVFKDQYIELSTMSDAKAKTFGIGESTRQEQVLQPGTTRTLWAADIAALGEYQNLYGSFPYYMQWLNGAAHGAMLLNSNGMDVSIDETALTFKTIGGIIDLYVFTGSTPVDVISQYTYVIGRPAMMPYWSLGFHNCKYGYTSLQQVEEVVANYSKAGIPLDTQWMDIDYMEEYRDFTYDAKNFNAKEVSAFVDTLHKNGQRFVPIVDPGIMIYKGYAAYEQGLKEGVFVKDISGGYYLGQVWPGPTYFPDFFHPAAQDYWTAQLKTFLDLAEYDGLWIDMNEVSNFCNVDGKGQVCVNTAPNGCPAPGASQTDCCLECSTVDSSNKFDFPPYNIHNEYNLLSTKTVAMSATHYGDVLVYDAHNLYGLTEQMATYNALATLKKKRPFMITRSSFISTGVHSGKWSGDNDRRFTTLPPTAMIGATWDDLRSSIVSLKDFNMFGIPMIGSDICGFIYDTTEELCARWIEVGAFYTFARDHNAIGRAPQELYLWESVTEAAKNALSIRYQLLPYMYTQFFTAYQTGAPVIRALWMNFPADAITVTETEQQFMIGDAVLISPVVTEGSTVVNAYFPTGLWYDFNELSLVDASSGGVFKELDTPLTKVNVHVRGSRVVALQQAAMTTTAARATPFTYLVALCAQNKAGGSLFYDDGEQISIDNYITVDYHAEVTDTKGTFTATVGHNTYAAAEKLAVSTVAVVGRELSAPKTATLNGKRLAKSQISFNNAKKLITFSDLDLTLVDNITLVWA